MILVVCLDDRNGMTFLKRRQSQDSVLRAHMLEMSRGTKLWMNGYSAQQFDAIADHMRVNEAFLDRAGAGEYCFAENVDVREACEKAEKLVIYRWKKNRHCLIKYLLRFR